jgi:hypothetical protein
MPVLGKGVRVWAERVYGIPPEQVIGRRPIACFGNSDGDLAMLQYTSVGNPRPSLGVIVHHTDAEREYAYDAYPRGTGRFVEALEEGGDGGGWDERGGGTLRTRTVFGGELEGGETIEADVVVPEGGGFERLAGDGWHGGS